MRKWTVTGAGSFDDHLAVKERAILEVVFGEALEVMYGKWSARVAFSPSIPMIVACEVKVMWFDTTQQVDKERCEP